MGQIANLNLTFQRFESVFFIGSNKQIRLVEITYVAHTLKNYLSIVSEGKSPSEFEKFVREKGGEFSGYNFVSCLFLPRRCLNRTIHCQRYFFHGVGPIILNYRFIRDYTSGVEDSWTINAINHFPLVRA